jgi:hypothetical protein
MDLIKYPRTQHIRGSRLQPGDEDLEQVSASSLLGKHLVIEEKVDGANSAISFDRDEKLHLQSRGHYLTGGPREAQFTLFKQWAACHADVWSIALGDRYIAYGEWLYRKHTVFYDQLPHYWMEFDILDRARSTTERPWFLDTRSRIDLLHGLQYAPVKVLWSGKWTPEMRIDDFVTQSNFKSACWRQRLREQAALHGHNWETIWKHTDPADTMEGLYIKWEDDGRVMGRFKFVRHDFVSLIVSNEEHHLNLPSVPNLLADGVDLFAA